MSRLLTKTGIELPTFSPALGPESVNRKPKKFSTEPLKSLSPTKNQKSSNNYFSEFNFEDSNIFNFDVFNQFYLTNEFNKFSKYEPTSLNYGLNNSFEESFEKNQKSELSFQSFLNNFKFNFQF